MSIEISASTQTWLLDGIGVHTSVGGAVVTSVGTAVGDGVGKGVGESVGAGVVARHAVRST